MSGADAPPPRAGLLRDLSTVDLSAFLRPGDSILWGQSHAQPRGLIRQLVAQRHRFARTRLVLGIGHGLDDVLTPLHADAFDFVAYCGAGSNRRLAEAGVLDILPVNYSELAPMMDAGTLRIDVLMLQVSAADAQGRHSLGMAREYLVAALRCARTVLAEVNPSVPWTAGGPYLSAGDVDLWVASEDATADVPAATPGPIELAIGRRVANLVPDGATLQTGIGTVPDAVLHALRSHRDLGLHSGSLGEAMVDLAASGALTNARKALDRGVTIGGILLGGRRLREFAHGNPALELRSCEYIHDAEVLARHERFIAVNSAVEVDLGGQVNSEVVGETYVGAVGGASDFLRGASRSHCGVPIVALPSTAGHHSRIVARLSGPATVPRSLPCVIVTEHGVADLRGLTLSQRRDRLLAIAHPQHQPLLESQLSDRPLPGTRR